MYEETMTYRLHHSKYADHNESAAYPALPPKTNYLN